MGLPGENFLVLTDRLARIPRRAGGWGESWGVGALEAMACEGFEGARTGVGETVAYFALDKSRGICEGEYGPSIQNLERSPRSEVVLSWGSEYGS